jgi:hypothetical protein
MKGGVYAYRTRKPGARFNIPILSRHWAYVGETTSFWHRDRQHLAGDLAWGTLPKPWCDLDPVCYRISLPGWKWLLRSVETLLILCLWPVYNHAKNQWNPRRIPLSTALAMRAARDRGRWYPNVRFIHVIVSLAPLAVAAYYLGGHR